MMEAQTSVSLTVDVRDDEGGPVRAESSVASDGDCVGRISAGGGQAQVIQVGSMHYLKGDAAFWTWASSRPEGIDIPQFWVGRWVKGSLATLDHFGVETMCSLSDAVGNLTADFGGTKHEVGPRTILGRQAVTVTETGSGGSLTLDVAATGTAAVLRGVQKAPGSATVTTTFTGLGVAVHAKAPAGAVG
ncbi:hypothetical protein [Streptomyces sp. NPDC020917]|uniref:hypothetical protein n=1 Tax=Streptomyces sp. NPDC020917 TaxID=3365102 RepID=UPI0037B8DB33